MAVIDNTTTTDDLVHALDVEMNLNFNQDMDRLAELLGIVSPEVIAAGQALYQYTVTGELVDDTTDEGDEVALSKYKLDKESIGDLEIKRYRKLTTAQAILKSGYENAILRTDDKMLRAIRLNIIEDFFNYLKNGTSSVSADSFKGVLAQADAKLGDVMEQNGDNTENIVHFVNRFDVADYLEKADVTMQTVFGMDYLASFLGIKDIFISSKVEKGTVYVTPAENLHLYGVDFGSLNSAGLAYTAYEGSLIGVAHEAAYDRASAQTHVISGAKLLAEITDYIVKGDIVEKA